jgi:hypothetical protein
MEESLVKEKWPQIYFGKYSEEKRDWRVVLADEPDDDDDELRPTSPDVIGMLGFDPVEEFGPRDGGLGKKKKTVNDSNTISPKIRLNPDHKRKSK